MKQYKGYYIDHVIYNSKEDIDKAIERRAIETYKNAIQCFANRPTMEASDYCGRQAERLVKQFGFSWAEVEAFEIEALECM